MEPGITQDVLKTTRASARVVAVVVIIGAAFFMYKTYLETKLVRLQIKELEKEIAGNTANST